MTAQTDWRFLDTGPGDPVYNMALDEALLFTVQKGISQPTIRFYCWKVPTLTLGYRQDYFLDINHQVVKESNIPVVRRITGGLAVYHWWEVTYSVTNQLLGSQQIRNSFHWYGLISKGIVMTLNDLGIPAEINLGQPRKEDIKRGKRKNSNQYALCFTLPIGVDITVNGKKIVGSAQRRFRNTFIQQGSILIQRCPEKEVSIIKHAFTGNNIDLENKIFHQVTSLVEEKCPVIEYTDLVPRLVKNMENSLGIKVFTGKITDLEEELCEKLIETKYSTKSWNFHGSWHVHTGCLK